MAMPAAVAVGSGRQCPRLTRRGPEGCPWPRAGRQTSARRPARARPTQWLVTRVAPSERRAAPTHRKRPGSLPPRSRQREFPSVEAEHSDRADAPSGGAWGLHTLLRYRRTSGASQVNLAAERCHVQFAPDKGRDSLLDVLGFVARLPLDAAAMLEVSSPHLSRSGPVRPSLLPQMRRGAGP